MGGIIQGFLGGAANAMGEAGKMAFANQLTKERDEANFLRDSELAKTLKREDITSREKISANDLAGRERIAKSRDKTLLEAANVRAAATKAGSNSLSSQQKNINDLLGRGKTLNEAIQLVYPSATIKHTDPDGNQIVVVQTDEGFQEIGKIMVNDKGEQEWVEAGEEPTRTKPTKAEREAKAAEMNEAEGRGDDWIPFNEYNSSDKEVKDAAAAGLVDSAAKGSTKKVGTRQMTKQQFIEAMVGRYGQDKLADIEATWESIK